MISVVLEMMSYPFIVRAMIVGILVSLCSSLLGVSLVLKKYSMIGEGLSHVSFGAIAIAVALGVSPLKISIPIVVIVAFLLLRIKESSKIKGDSAIALISSSSLAIGVISIAITTGMNTDVCNYMFGSILAMSKNDVYLSVVLSIVVIFLFTIYYNKIFAITFDENFTKSTGINVNFYNMMIAILTAITIVLGMRMMGAMLISSLIIFPSIISMKIFKSFKSVVMSSGIVSILSFCIGMTISYKFSTPTGASIVVVNIIIFILSIIVEKVKSNNRSYI
ncbi:ABC transporter permease [[Clostridium] sordellii]|uniref:ABC transporter, permease protein n=1 Tax=Paraclostridium sordellii TaxID=1505 RepID=A0ABP1XM73_PARSO|nr:metal ABC transporter permease [Paeniclostridium sordellii]CEJ72435.1 putative ABC transporter, permease protein [[Clostridium] sordellii] [Paeniclostridium sordellii]CEN70661.1 ABC transporter permease [[Clostridium] sordellii] [Paeniclostridium sordellii]CEN73842.1 ABC transporter permease [[Clostridium] sordellii] [Paeniclostridium sordellii]CEO28703.1 ABC transporter permease [[Clostridium] sordellii] [Paeniclostridium sordellii]CEP77131.1 ABC transporter permease [[Clostridium] sordell